MAISEKRRKYNQRYLEKNRDKIRARRRALYQQNKTLRQELSRNDWRKNSAKYTERKLLSKYGLTSVQRDALFEAQGKRCAICRTANFGGGGKRPHVDHDHTTGIVRGLLCHRCNAALGLFRDCPEYLEVAIKYLKRHLFPHG